MILLVLVENQHLLEPIYAGLKEEKYAEEKIFIAKDLEEALVKMNQIMDSTSVILLENDLPDNYL